MMYERLTSHDLRQQIVGISSDKLCLRMAKLLLELRPAYVARVFVPDDDVDDSVPQYLSLAVLECAISVYT